MTKKIVLTLNAYELGILWGLTMREDLQDDVPESLRNKIHTLVDMAYENAVGEDQEN